MTTKLRHNVQVSQAVHGADDVMTLHIWSQVNSLNIYSPLVDTLIYYIRLECRTQLYWLWL